MKRGPIVVTVSLALMASLALAPAAAAADRFHGGTVRGHGIGGSRPFASHRFVSRPFSSRPFFPHSSFPHRFSARPFSHRFVPFGVISSPVVVFAPPVVYGAPAYSDQSGYYNPPAAYSQPPPVYNPPLVYNAPLSRTVSVAPSPPSVVEYPTGRYELRGDGMTTPYTWVWIPNPPPAPPAAAPPAGAPASGDASPSRHGQLYRWTDAQGVVHLTDRWDAVPEEYRTQAKQNKPS